MDEAIRFKTGVGDLVATPENASLHRYKKLGKAGVNLAIYDHIFLITDDDPIYIFMIEMSEQDKDAISSRMIDGNFECHLNLDSVSKSDTHAFDQVVIRPLLKGIEAGIPSNWK